ncbi:hypothetical protein BDE02_09G143000 [Populus trichocarpa]|nr:hypothetical protein BDE02_09G143000 [Populus trichocarpa]
MDSDSSAPTVRASVVQATTVFYDTPATLEDQVLVLLLVGVQLKAERISGSIMLQPLLFLIRKTAPKTFSFCESYANGGGAYSVGIWRWINDSGF